MKRPKAVENYIEETGDKKEDGDSVHCKVQTLYRRNKIGGQAQNRQSNMRK